MRKFERVPPRSDDDEVAGAAGEVEAKRLRQRVLSDEEAAAVVERVLGEIQVGGFEVLGSVKSPILGSGGNAEWVAWLRNA